MSPLGTLRSGWERVGRPLDALRVPPGRRWILQLAFAGVGLAPAALHWSGLLVGGALLGLLSDSWRRAVLAGFAFGVLVWFAFVFRLALSGGLATYLASGQLLLVCAAVAIGLATIGGLARALFP